MDRAPTKYYPQHIKTQALAMVFQGFDIPTIMDRLAIEDSTYSTAAKGASEGLPENSIIASWCRDPELVRLVQTSGSMDIMSDQFKAKAKRNINMYLDLANDPEKLRKTSTLQFIMAATALQKALNELEAKQTTPPNLTQINVNIDNSKQSIDLLDAEEQALSMQLASLRNLATASTAAPMGELTTARRPNHVHNQIDMDGL